MGLLSEVRCSAGHSRHWVARQTTEGATTVEKAEKEGKDSGGHRSGCCEGLFPALEMQKWPGEGVSLHAGIQGGGGAKVPALKFRFLHIYG
jgi:hypothetical protein